MPDHNQAISILEWWQTNMRKQIVELSEKATPVDQAERLEYRRRADRIRAWIEDVDGSIRALGGPSERASRIKADTASED